MISKIVLNQRMSRHPSLLGLQQEKEGGKEATAAFFFCNRRKRVEKKPRQLSFFATGRYEVNFCSYLPMLNSNLNWITMLIRI
uniref:Uncharacterized protein n=1 Tax=Picea sitchensis TaxID=3332 RepID=D5A8Y4_PICSI|nr:unknown [Picea sitchensis]